MRLIHHDRCSMELSFADDAGGYITIDYGMSTMSAKDVIDLIGISRPEPSPEQEYGVACSLGGG